MKEGKSRGKGGLIRGLSGKFVVFGKTIERRRGEGQGGPPKSNRLQREEVRVRGVGGGWRKHTSYATGLKRTKERGGDQ